MVVINRELLYEFAKKHASTRKSLATWQKMTADASWKSKKDVLQTFPNAKMLRNNRARFEIQHNRYRLIAEVIYDKAVVIVRFLGTHTEYDRIDPETI